MTKKRRTKTKGKKLNRYQLQSEILRLFQRHPKKHYSAKQIIKKLKIGNNKDAVTSVLDKLSQHDKLKSVADHKYKLIRANSNGTAKSNGRSRATGREYYEGKVDMTRSGSAYIIVEGLENDVHISPKNMNNALNGDIVKIAAWTPRGRNKPEGEVIEVLQRATEHFIGTVNRSKNYAFVIPDRERMPTDIYVDLKNLKAARDKEKVVVKIVKWPTKESNSPEGVVTSVLGEVGSSDIEMKSILISNGFDLEHNPKALRQANAISEEIKESEIAKRRDFREITTFTIDPLTAKDFDDALSIEYFDKGEFEIGVHIADVTHYVKPNTALDKEAFERSTSVYLVDRVLPMLPEKLSNVLCSLRPNEEKLTFSVAFRFDKKFKLIDTWIGKTIIYSDRRFTYEEAQEVIETKEGDFVKEVNQMNDVAVKLRTERFKKGSIDFSADEVKFKLNDEGEPIDVYVKERKAAHMLVEEFMLLANKAVAKFIDKKIKQTNREIPFVYRVHDSPDPDKVADFINFARELGVKISANTPEEIAEAYNKLEKITRENDALKMLQPLAIRTMAKAEYTTNNIGHYGLGFEFYSHFTSPIRRYSDVLAHRILFKNLKRATRVDKEALEGMCKHISAQERHAVTAERESVKYKQVEYIKKHVGEEFMGVVSGIIDRGLFVELKHSRCEGMIAFSSLGEPFILGQGRLEAKGVNTGETFKMGQEVRVLITGADLAKRQIEMELVEE